MNKNVIIIGAGAAGLIAAGFVAQRGANVSVLEKKGQAASKVRISGKGRCNITNAMPIKEFPQHYPGNGRFLYGALHRFSNEDCIQLFTDLDVKVKVERGQRVFPESDSAHEVADALEHFARKNGAKIFFNQDVLEIEQNDQGKITGVVSERGGKENFFPADAVIVATGGLSYPGTGSTGDGLKFARRLGHTVIPPRAALVPVKVLESWVRDVSGLSLKNIELVILNPTGGEERFFGELMFSHVGLTGPVVLTASERMGTWLKQSRKPLQVLIDLKPALSAEQLDRRLLRDLETFSRKQFGNYLSELLPKSLIPVIIDLVGIPAEKLNHQVTREERLALRSLLKNLPLTVSQTFPLSTAIVTAGGVDVKEIEPKTMESKIVPGLFFAGEVLDIHGVTGGFNLQAAFSTGFCAAQGVSLE